MRDLGSTFFCIVRFLHVRLYNICVRCMRVREFEAEGGICVSIFFRGCMYSPSPHLNEQTRCFFFRGMSRIMPR